MSSRRSIKPWEDRLSRQSQFRPGHVGGRVASAQPIRRRGGTLRGPAVGAAGTPAVSTAWRYWMEQGTSWGYDGYWRLDFARYFAEGNIAVSNAGESEVFATFIVPPDPPPDPVTLEMWRMLPAWASPSGSDEWVEVLDEWTWTGPFTAGDHMTTPVFIYQGNHFEDNSLALFKLWVSQDWADVIPSFGEGPIGYLQTTDWA